MRLLLVTCLVLTGCEPTAVEEVEPVELTLRLTLAGGRDIGATPGRIHVYADSVAVPRARAFPDFGEVCVLAATPVTICTFSVPRGSMVSLIAADPEPAVVVRLAPQSPQDTVRDGRYVEFTRWTECPDQAERGLCVLRAAGETTIEANFQLMQQVSVYQTGAARMDFITFAAGPMLQVPAVNYNILNLAGCRRTFPALMAPCDSIRMVGDSPYHRFTAYVLRKTIVGMLPLGGVATEFARWDGNCIPSILGGGVCSVVTPDTVVGPIILTVRYSWWRCPTGPSDHDTGGCVLQEVFNSTRSDRIR
jgi:hypothetical protein